MWMRTRRQQPCSEGSPYVKALGMFQAVQKPMTCMSDEPSAEAISPGNPKTCVQGDSSSPAGPLDLSEDR